MICLLNAARSLGERHVTKYLSTLSLSGLMTPPGKMIASKSVAFTFFKCVSTLNFLLHLL